MCKQWLKAPQWAKEGRYCMNPVRPSGWCALHDPKRTPLVKRRERYAKRDLDQGRWVRENLPKLYSEISDVMAGDPSTLDKYK
jgi:hypothetical protein